MAALSGLIFACAVCGASEQTLPTNGTEVPFEGRKRATLELRAASFETRDHALKVVEMRAEPGVAMAVTEGIIVSAHVPLLRRTLDADGAVAREPSASGPALPPRTAQKDSATAMSLGDVELLASHTAWKSEPSALRRRLVVTAGLKLPTAPIEHDPQGQTVHPDLQPGCSSIVPEVGISHAWSSSLWSAWTGVSLLFPVAVHEGAHSGDSLRGSFTLQLQPTRILATRLGVVGRYDGTGEADGEVVKRSGGGAVNVAPEIVVMPTQDLVVAVGASFPVVQEMRGYRATAPVLLASIGMDF